MKEYYHVYLDTIMTKLLCSLDHLTINYISNELF